MNAMSEPETSPTTTYVGYIWIDDQPFQLKITAASLDEAIAAVKAQHGDSHVVALWREPERPRTKLYVGYAWIGDAPGIRLEFLAATPGEAYAAAKAQYGEDSVVSVWNEQDANKPRRSNGLHRLRGRRPTSRTQPRAE
jgi:hypothetical protein